jgi:hypothetical protein
MVSKMSHGQDEKFKSIFIYNFTKYINWPPKAGNFVVTVFDQPKLAAELEDIATKKTVGTLTMEVKKINSVSGINNCHILFLSASKSEILPEVVEKCKQLKILLVTEKEGSCAKGAAINFITQDGKLKFEVSKNNIISSGLEVSNDLIRLSATNVQ